MKNEEELNQNQNCFRLFFPSLSYSKRAWSKSWSMCLPGDSSNSSRKIITMKMRQSLGHFGTKRVKLIFSFLYK